MKNNQISKGQIEIIIEVMEGKLKAVKEVHEMAKADPQNYQPAYTNGYITAVEEDLRLFKMLLKEDR